MDIYILTCALSMIIAYFMQRFRRKGKPLPLFGIVIGSALPCILVSGLRYGIGTDYFGYEGLFLFGDSTWQAKNFIAPLYFNIYNPLIQYLGGDYAVSVFIVAASFFCIVFMRIFEDSPYPCWSIFLLFGMTYFFASMNTMRQFLGLAFLLYSLKYIEEDRKYMFFLFVAIATGIHSACILFIVVYFLYRIDAVLTPKFICIITPIIFASFFLLRNTVFSDIINYFNYDKFIGGESGGIFITLLFLWQIILLILANVCYGYNTSADSQKKYKIYFTTQIITLWVFAFVSLVNANELIRILWIVGFPTIIFTPMVVRRLPTQLLRVSIISIFSICWFICMYVYITSGAHSVLPYQSLID